MSNMVKALDLGRKGYHFENWSKTFTCKPEFYFEPDTIDEIKQILQLALDQKKKVKVVGCRHSPSDIACTTQYMINIQKFDKIIKVDKDSKQVTVQAGITLTAFQKQLEKYKMSVSLMPSVSDVTLAGAIATGTHGTGVNHGILATSVVALTLLTGTGEVIHCSEKEKPEVFEAALCNLGAMGIILDLTWQCEDMYKLQSIRHADTLDNVLDNLESEVNKSEHFRFLWWPHTDHVAVWHVDHTDKPVQRKKSWFWDYLVGFHFLQFVYWISSFLPWLVKYINQYHFSWLMSGPEEIVDMSEKIFTFDCLFQQYVTDWAIPRDKTARVLRALKKWLNESGFYAHMPVEVRFTKGDQIPISPAYGCNTCFINIIMYRPYGKCIPHEDYWNFYEDLMFSVGGRPHWAKAHKMSPEMLEKMYPRFDDFRNICRKLDPHRLFVNEYLERTIFDSM